MISNIRIGSLVIFKDITALKSGSLKTVWTGIVLSVIEENVTVFWDKQKVWTHEKEDLQLV